MTAQALGFGPSPSSLFTFLGSGGLGAAGGTGLSFDISIFHFLKLAWVYDLH
jgi:hypothetical protein